MLKITDIKAREILDSRGNPTVEVDVVVENKYLGRASVPSGASTGQNEAIELRDCDAKRYLGKGVLRAVENVNSLIKKSIIGMDAQQQEHVDDFLISLDGTENKAKLGANAILGVSLATAKAAALAMSLPLFKYLNPNSVHFSLPKTFMNIINGGAHADNKIEIQEFMIMPNIENSAVESIRVGAEIFHNLKSILKTNGFNTSVGDEGGFAPDLNNIHEALDFIMQAITKAGYVPGRDVMLALDCAANEFYRKGYYNIERKEILGSGLINYYAELVKNYPIVYLEDPLAEDDYQSWKECTSKLDSDTTMIVGDDLFVTNSKLLSKGIKDKVANSILIKPNQIGTLSETIKTIKMAQEANYKTVISHRSGETEDVSIAHLAVAFNAGYIKTGSLSRTDRVAKYNELIRIEEMIKTNL